jgi:hypothetical protein
MYRHSVAELDTDKSHPGTYRIGGFLISRAKSRWRVSGQNATVDMEFSTLRGAVAWCRQQLTAMPMNRIGAHQPKSP